MTEMERVFSKRFGFPIHAYMDADLMKLWRLGIEPIRDETLRNTLITYLTDVVPDGFYTGAATRSGKHHPDWHTGEYGILKNTWECCLLVPKLAIAFPDIVLPDYSLDPAAIDVALTATIVSDSFKWSADGKWNGDTHLRLAAEAWDAHTKAHGLELHDLCARALNAVLWHHGVYSPGWRPCVRLSGECQLVHMADLVMAQRCHAAPLRTDTE